MDDLRAIHCATAARIAKRLALRVFGDEDKANEMYVLGFLHDVGYGLKSPNDPVEVHPSLGGSVLKSCGFKYYEEVSLHGYLLPSMSDELLLLNLSDMLATPPHLPNTIPDRLSDISSRFGSSSPQFLTASSVATFCTEEAFRRWGIDILTETPSLLEEL